MKHKIAASLCAAAAMVFLICVTIFGEAPTITQDDVNNITNREVMEKIADVMLKDAGREGDVSPEDVVKIDVLYGDFTGEGKKQAVISADFGPRYTIVSVYEDNNGKYRFVGEVGVFTDTADLRVVSLQNKNRDAIFINEILNEKIGAFEKLEYDKGYIWADESQKFVNIFNYPVRIRADWNMTWSTSSTEAPSQWERVTQTTKSILENGNNPVIRSRFHQEYLTSSDTNALNIPLDNTYTLVRERDIERNFYWNDDWNAFIIDEMIENSTGEKVAVLVLWSDLPYSLAEYSEDEEENTPGYENLVRIRRKDGTTAVVNINTLSAIKNDKRNTTGASV